MQSASARSGAGEREKSADAGSGGARDLNRENRLAHELSQRVSPSRDRMLVRHVGEEREKGAE